MIKILETPIYMTVEEIMEKYYPLRVVIANCEISYHAPIAGYVVATEGVPDDDYPELSDYEIALHRGGEHGAVYMIETKDPAEGEWIYVEFVYPD